MAMRTRLVYWETVCWSRTCRGLGQAWQLARRSVVSDMHSHMQHTYHRTVHCKVIMTTDTNDSRECIHRRYKAVCEVTASYTNVWAYTLSI